MAVAGALEVQMFANLARLSKDMADAKSMVGGAMSSIEKSVSQAKSALDALGIGLSVGFFANLVKGSIDAMDHLNDLNKTTRLSVETLAGLKVAAKQSGGDLDSLAASVVKLSVEMGKAPEKFKALGITAKDPLEAFKQMSDLFVKLEDTQQRNAFAAAALGKSWQGAAPALEEGSENIQKMIDKGQIANGTTTEMAKRADELNDKWELLTGTGGTMVALIGPLLPLLNAVADDMLKTKESADSLTRSLNPLVEIMKVLLVIASDVSFVFTTIGKDMARAVENVQLIARGDFAGSRALGEAFRADAEAARKALDEYQKTIMNAGTVAKSPATGTPAGGTSQADADAAARKVRAFLEEQELKAAAVKRAAMLEREQKERQTLLDRYQKMDNDRWVRDIEEQFKRDADAQMREHEKAIRKNQQRETDLESLRQSLLTEEELEQEAYVKKLKVLIEANEAGLVLDGEMMVIREQMEEAHRKRLLEIIMRTGTAERKWEVMNTQQRVQSVLQEAIKLTDGVAQQSRAMFEINKAASIANAIISTYEGAQNAYTAMSKIPIVGPALGIAAAGLAIAAGIARVNAIRSTTFGGGSSPSLAGGTAAPPVSIAQPQESPLTAQQQNQQPREVRIQINSGRTIFNRQDLEEIMQGMNEIAADGFPTRFSMDPA